MTISGNKILPGFSCKIITERKIIIIFTITNNSGCSHTIWSDCISSIISKSNPKQKNMDSPHLENISFLIHEKYPLAQIQDKTHFIW